VNIGGPTENLQSAGTEVRPGKALSRIDGGVVALLAVATLGIGWVRSSRNSFWIDEAATGLYMRRSFGGLIRLLWHEGGMAPYYVGLWFWTRFSHSDW
jgi:hypothetical protein